MCPAGCTARQGRPLAGGRVPKRSQTPPQCDFQPAPMNKSVLFKNGSSPGFGVGPCSSVTRGDTVRRGKTKLLVRADAHPRGGSFLSPGSGAVKPPTPLPGHGTRGQSADSVTWSAAEEAGIEHNARLAPGAKCALGARILSRRHLRIVRLFPGQLRGALFV